MNTKLSVKEINIYTNLGVH